MAKKKSKKIIIISVVALILVAVALIIIIPILRQAKPVYTEENVTVATIKNYYTFSGVVESKDTQTLISDKPMQITEVLVKDSDKVKVGDILVKTSAGEQLKAKIDGTVSQLNVKPDQTVMAGTLICSVLNFDELQTTIKIDEYDLNCVKLNDEVTVKIGAIDTEIKGTISSISNTATTVNGLSYFTAVVDLQKQDNIKIGMTAEAKIANQTASDSLTLSMESLKFHKDKKPYVLIKDDKDKIVSQDITVGINDGRRVEIKSGLSKGQSVFYEKSEDIESTAFMPPMMTK
ncbi:MAG: HlyD family efflux transporter periplasmic adaptor subunit [Oscillospiraceae bacterium]